MKIVQINATCGIGSTGKICVGISKLLAANDIENSVMYSSAGDGYEFGIRCSSPKYIKIQALKSKILGNYGFNSKRITRKIICMLREIKPDVVHLHNIHGHDCDLEALFTFFKKNNTKIVWTFHDCWAFTGYCVHFDMIGCNKWQNICMKCPQKNRYTWLLDKSSNLYEKKKKLFSGLDLTIVTPSHWLEDIVKKSFLKDYSIKVINNGIDLNVFKPSESDFRKKYGLENKRIILGVAFKWDEKKGLDVFVELAQRLPEDYKIVLVGTDDKVDKQIPNIILSLHRTQNQRELCEIYSAADVLINPTREDTFPTVNMEALACGTPVVTFDTGGCAEILDDSCGVAIEKNNIDSLEKHIIYVCEEKPYGRDACFEKAKSFDMHKRFQEYIDLYREVSK